MKNAFINYFLFIMITEIIGSWCFKHPIGLNELWATMAFCFLASVFEVTPGKGRRRKG